MLAEAAIQRHSRQILLREVGGRGQHRLQAACVSIPVLNEGGRAGAMWLARAGVGALLLPSDGPLAPAVDASGLLWSSDAGRPLSEVVRFRLPFHAPGLSFEGAMTHALPDTSSAGEGVQASMSLVRRIVGD